MSATTTHYLARPLVANVPAPANPSWVMVECGRCSRSCWRRPDDEPDPLPAGVEAVCTLCALKLGAGSAPRDPSDARGAGRAPEHVELASAVIMRYLLDSGAKAYTQTAYHASTNQPAGIVLAIVGTPGDLAKLLNLFSDAAEAAGLTHVRGAAGGGRAGR